MTEESLNTAPSLVVAPSLFSPSPGWLAAELPPPASPSCAQSRSWTGGCPRSSPRGCQPWRHRCGDRRWQVPQVTNRPTTRRGGHEARGHDARMERGAPLTGQIGYRAALPTRRALQRACVCVCVRPWRIAIRPTQRINFFCAGTKPPDTHRHPTRRPLHTRLPSPRPAAYSCRAPDFRERNPRARPHPAAAAPPALPARSNAAARARGQADAGV